jgi:hypothetical protein
MLPLPWALVATVALAALAEALVVTLYFLRLLQAVVALVVTLVIMQTAVMAVQAEEQVVHLHAELEQLTKVSTVVQEMAAQHQLAVVAVQVKLEQMLLDL